MPFDSLGNIGPPQPSSNGRGSGRSSSARPMSFRRPSPLRRYSCAKSVWVDPLSAFLVGSSQEPGWWRLLQAFIECGLSIPIFVSRSLSLLGLASSCPTAVCLRRLLAAWSMPRMFLRHLLVNVWSLWVLVLVTRQVSAPYSRTDAI